MWYIISKNNFKWLHQMNFLINENCFLIFKISASKKCICVFITFQNTCVVLLTAMKTALNKMRPKAHKSSFWQLNDFLLVMFKKESNNYMKVIFCLFNSYFLKCFLLDAKTIILWFNSPTGTFGKLYEKA